MPAEELRPAFPASRLRTPQPTTNEPAQRGPASLIRLNGRGLYFASEVTKSGSQSECCARSPLGGRTRGKSNPVAFFEPGCSLSRSVAEYFAYCLPNHVEDVRLPTGMSPHGSFQYHIWLFILALFTPFAPLRQDANNNDKLG